MVSKWGMFEKEVPGRDQVRDDNEKPGSHKHGRKEERR